MKTFREGINKALENNGLEVFYQPIYSGNEKKITAAEALVRLKDDEMGYISPEKLSSMNLLSTLLLL